MRPLRFLEVNVYAFPLHPLDLDCQLHSQRTRLWSEFRHSGQGFTNQGVSDSESKWHVC